MHRKIGATLAKFNLVFDGVFDGVDEGGRNLAICYFRGLNCKLQIYMWEAAGEIGCMIGPAEAPNEFGLLGDSKKWSALTRFATPRPALPCDGPVSFVPTGPESYAKPLGRVRSCIDAYYDEACMGVLAVYGPEPAKVDDFIEVPSTGAVAVYRAKRYPIAFSSDDWVALQADPEVEIPDVLQRGASGRRETRTYKTWAKVPRTSVDEIVHMRVTGVVAGHSVSIQSQRSDGQVSVDFVGAPNVAKQLGLKGDQHMCWTGLFAPEDFEDIVVEEVRRE